ncbi:hypothetical protein ACWEV4_24255 [Streptomyces sp. NPDC003860]
MALVAVLVVLVVWAISSGGGDGDKSDSANGSSSPAPSITPGPGQSGPAISGQPGGRDEPGRTGDDGGSGADTGGGTGSGGAGSDGGGTGGSDGGSGGGGAGGGVAAERVPVSSVLPNCPSGAIQLGLATSVDSYAPGQQPVFRLAVTNSSATTCKVDLGGASAVLKVTDAENEEVWSSKDCPRDGAAAWVKVPAHSTVSHAVTWERKRSAPQCATPPAAPVGAGTYLVEAQYPGETVRPTSFVLAKD